MLDNAKIESFKSRLIAMKQELSSLSISTEDARKPVALDQQSVGRLSRMDAMQRQAMQMETDRRRKVCLIRVDAALSRIKDDEFGYCAACGEELEERRLDHDPSVTNCVKCAR